MSETPIPFPGTERATDCAVPDETSQRQTLRSYPEIQTISGKCHGRQDGSSAVDLVPSSYRFVKECRIEKVELGTDPTVTLMTCGLWQCGVVDVGCRRKIGSDGTRNHPKAERQTQSLLDASGRRIDRIHIRSQVLTIYPFALLGAFGLPMLV